MRAAFDPKKSFRIDKFDGGLNTKNNATNIPQNQSPSAQNVVFDDYGSVGTRNGFSQVNTAPIGTATGDGLVSYVNQSGTAKLVAACNGSLWYLSGTTFITIPSSQSLFTAGVNMEMRTFRDKLFVSNGGKQPYKWNGTEFTRMGVSAPTATMTVATGAAGSLSGTYNYVMWGVNSALAEGDYGVTAGPITVASTRVNVGGIITAPASHGINTWKIGRNTAGVQGVYYLVTSITNGTTSFVDNAADSALVTLAPTDKGYPRYFKYMVSAKGRLFGAGESGNPSYLWFSNLNQPEEFPSTNFIQVGNGDGMVISGLSIQDDMVVIAKSDTKGQTATWLLSISDSTGVSSVNNWYLKKMSAPYGAESHRSMVGFSNVLGFLNRQGFFAIGGNNLALSLSETDKSRFSVDSHSFDIEPDVFAFKTSLLPNAAAIIYKNKMWLSVPGASNSTGLDKIYQYDFVRASSERRDVGAWAPFTGHAIAQFAVHEDMLYGISSTANGLVYLLDSTHNDNGSAINSYFITAALGGDDKEVEQDKVFRFVYLWVEATGAWPLAFSYYTDFDTGTGDVYNIDLTSSGSQWGTMIWGVDTWGGASVRKRVRVDLRNAKGKRIQFKFATNAVDRFWKVHSLETFYNTRGLR